MKIINRNQIEIDSLPGRGIQRAVGKDGVFNSTEMTVGYAIYKAEYGEMEPHRHGEETVIITESLNGKVYWGSKKEQLFNQMKLEKGMILHIPENEWHVFKYDEGGYIEIVFIYGNVDNVRPEDK